MAKKPIPHSLSRVLARRIRNVTGEAKGALSIKSRIQKWIQTRGPEGAIDLLKRNGQALRAYLFGLPTDPNLCIARYNGFPLVFQDFRGCSVEQLVRLSKLAAAITLERITPRQREKFLSAVQKEPLQDCSYPSARCFLALGLKGVPPLRYLPEPSLVIDEFKWAQSESGADEAYLVSVSPYMESLTYVVLNGLHERFPFIRECFRPALWSSLEQSVFPNLTRDKLGPYRLDAVGVVGAAQEPAGKLRCFGSPYTVFHCAQVPLQKALQTYLFRLGQDSQFNQRGIGAVWAQEELRKGKVVHSVDLTNATDAFPLILQTETLRGIGIPEDHVALFEYVSTGDYLPHPGLVEAGFPSRLRWSVGQPLGSKPSFQAFSLAHIVLLRGICMSLGLTHYPFRVLGDDVVISDDTLHRIYREVLSEIGVTVSESKSYSSSAYAEFAGHSIWCDGLFLPGKWREASHSNYLSLVDQLGSTLPGEVSARYQRAAELYLASQQAKLSTPDDEPVDIMDFDVPILRGRSFRPIGQRKAILDAMERYGITLGEPWVTRRVQMGVIPEWAGGGFEPVDYQPIIPSWLNKAAPWGPGLAELFKRKPGHFISLDQAYLVCRLALRMKHGLNPLLGRMEAECDQHFARLVYTRPRKSNPWRNLLVKFLHDLYKQDHRPLTA